MLSDVMLNYLCYAEWRKAEHCIFNVVLTGIVLSVVFNNVILSGIL
jgi:hypothetical protein